MTRWTVVLAAFLLVLGTHPHLGAQEATAEIEVVVWGQIKHLVHDCPIDARGRIEAYAPDLVTCRLRALDADSLWTPAVFSVELEGPPGRVEASVADSTLTMSLVSRSGLPGVRVLFRATPVPFPDGG
jgi:hypothetical protein